MGFIHASAITLNGCCFSEWTFTLSFFCDRICFLLINQRNCIAFDLVDQCSFDLRRSGRSSFAYFCLIAAALLNLISQVYPMIPNLSFWKFLLPINLISQVYAMIPNLRFWKFLLPISCCQDNFSLINVCLYICYDSKSDLLEILIMLSCW